MVFYFIFIGNFLLANGTLKAGTLFIFTPVFFESHDNSLILTKFFSLFLYFWSEDFFGMTDNKSTLRTRKGLLLFIYFIFILFYFGFCVRGLLCGVFYVISRPMEVEAGRKGTDN